MPTASLSALGFFFFGVLDGSLSVRSAGASELQLFFWTSARRNWMTSSKSASLRRLARVFSLFFVAWLPSSRLPISFSERAVPFALFSNPPLCRRLQIWSKLVRLQQPQAHRSSQRAALESQRDKEALWARAFLALLHRVCPAHCQGWPPWVRRRGCSSC